MSVGIVAVFILSALSVLASAAQADSMWYGSLPESHSVNYYDPNDPYVESRAAFSNGNGEMILGAKMLQTIYHEDDPNPDYYYSTVKPMITVNTLGTVDYLVHYDFTGGTVSFPSMQTVKPDLRYDRGQVIVFPLVQPYNEQFTFPYFGYEYDRFYLSENGYITFGQIDNYSLSTPQATFPDSSFLPNGVVAPLWTDLTSSGTDITCGYSNEDWGEMYTYSIYWNKVGSAGGQQEFMLSLRQDGAIIIWYRTISSVTASSGYENIVGSKGRSLSPTEVVSGSTLIIYPTPGSYQYIDTVRLNVEKSTLDANGGYLRDVSDGGVEFTNLYANYPWKAPSCNVWTFTPHAKTDNPDPDYSILVGWGMDAAEYIPKIGKFLKFVPFLGYLVDYYDFAKSCQDNWVPQNSGFANSSKGVDAAAYVNAYACDWAALPTGYERPPPHTFYCMPTIEWRVYDIARAKYHLLRLDLSVTIHDSSGYNPLDPSAGYTPTYTTYDSGELVFKFYPGAPTITVSSPNGGESWVAGTTHAITWTSNPGSGSLVNIDLIKGSTTTRLASDVPNTGSYAWTLPTTIAAGSDYKVQVSGKWIPISDSSNAAFTITNPYIYVRVLSPNGGELLWANGYLYVTFTYGGFSQFTNIHGYLYKGATSVIDLGLSAAGAGWFGITIPDATATGTDYRIKIAVEGNPSINDFSDNYFSIGNDNDAWFTITSPNGGEYWLPGQTHTISWQSGNILTGGVNILLYESGVATKAIVYNAPNTGSYVWTIPANAPSWIGGPNCQIRIYGADNHYQYVQDYSNAYFELDDSWIDVYYPGQDDTYVNPGGPCYIMWQNNQYPGDNYVNIVLYKGGVLDSNIASSTPNDGNYDWTVPSGQQIGTDYQIKVSSTTKAASDISKVFTITSFAVTSPNGGETWPAGTVHPVTWICSNPPPGVDVLIYLYKGGSPLNYNYVVTPNDGYCDWCVPANAPPGSDYRVQIVASATGIWLEDLSDAYFTISALPTITLTSPVGGESWQTWQTQTITWSSSGFLTDGGVNIILTGGGQSSEIAHATPNDGSYSWMIPCLPTAHDYRIFITGADPAYSQIMDWSDGTFTITHEHAPTTPGVPHLLTPGDEVDGIFTLTWDASLDDDSTPLAAYYLVEASKINGVWSGWVDISRTLPTNSISLMRPPGEYIYAVCAGDTADLWTSWAQMRYWPPFNEKIVVPAPLGVTGSASTTSGVTPLSVLFTCTASGGTSPYTYSWAFGDGGTSTLQNPTHVYSAAGQYVATCVVTDSGTQTKTWTSPTIDVQSPQPVKLTVNAGYYSSKNVWTTLTGTVWIDSVNVGNTGQAFTVTKTTHTVQVQDPITASRKTYWFQFWQGGTPSGNPGTITVSADMTIAAVFAQVTKYTLTMSVNNAAWGSTVPSGSPSYVSGTPVTVTAYPNAGYVFSYWLLDGVKKSGNPYTVTMGANHALQAVFQPQGVQTYSLTVNAYYFDGTSWKSFTSAWVKIDGVQVGNAGSSFTVTAGMHTIELQNSCTIKGKVYTLSYFDYNIPLSNGGTVNVQSNMSITARYMR
jgi:hypothetical protein